MLKIRQNFNVVFVTNILGSTTVRSHCYTVHSSLSCSKLPCEVDILNFTFFRQLKLKRAGVTGPTWQSCSVAINLYFGPKVYIL